jgi:hypothetical protein
MNVSPRPLPGGFRNFSGERASRRHYGARRTCTCTCGANGFRVLKIAEGRKKRHAPLPTSSMRYGGGRLAGLVGALMQSRVRVGSSPGIRWRWRQVGHPAVRRRVVSLLHGSRPHRSHSYAPAPVVTAVDQRCIVLHLLQIVERRLRKPTKRGEGAGGGRALLENRFQFRSIAAARHRRHAAFRRAQ